MSEQPKRPLAPYPQIGVASTCRSYREYVDMFDLNEAELAEGSVLDVAGGASSFVAQLRETGIRGIAVDPFYDGDKEEIIAKAQQEVEVSSFKVHAIRETYDWSYYGTPERHRKLREQSLEKFAADFRREDAADRYVAASLPNLPFADDTFRTVLCSHFLFLYGDQFDEAFHRQALDEMLRVAKNGGEVRIYPLVDLNWNVSPYIKDIMEWVDERADAYFLPSKLPFAPGSSTVLALRKR